MKKFLRRLLFLLVLIAIGAFGLRLYGQNQAELVNQQQPLIVDRVVIGAGDLTVTVSATGGIAPIRQVPLLFELVAPVRDVMVIVGQTVTTGDILATLETTDYETTLFDAQIALDLQQIAFDALTSPAREEDIAVAQASLTVAQVSVNAAYSTSLSQNTTQEEIARLQVELAGNQLWQAQLQRDAALTASTLPLIDINNLPPQIVDNVPAEFLDDVVNNINGLLGGITPSVEASQFDVQLNQVGGSVAIAQSNYVAAQNRTLDSSVLSSSQLALVQAQQTLDRLLNGATPDDVELAEIDLQRARLAVNQAESLLNRTQLRAPFDGIIAQNNLTIGELSPNTLPAILIMDVSNFVVDLPVDETDVVAVQIGQRVTFTLDALPDAEITGVVERVSLTPTKIGTLVTYLVRVRVDETDAPIKVGMSVTARIATQELLDVVLVPNRYIRIDRATQSAYVTIERAQGRFEEVQIEIGARNDRFTQVIAGVLVGDVVVLLPRGE
ncbi:MAG: efflux RND transporter periplasmic adaptor subunit [Phototrophicales bacterium]|nr:efflux RND transporter periplasmic adaptor subunit [Phototrophicales bacterium]